MRKWYENLAERERLFVTYGGIGVVIALLLSVVISLQLKVGATRERVTRKQGDLAYIQSVVPQFAASSTGAAVTNAESLVVLIDSTARESGLGKSLTSSQPSGERSLRIRLDKVPFDAMVAWLARLSQQNGVHVESAEIESAGDVGTVNAGLVLKAG